PPEPASQGRTSSELYNCGGGTWMATSAMHYPRVYHQLTRLSDGRVLASGSGPGSAGFQGEPSEIFDGHTGLWSNTGAMATERVLHSATLITTGANAGKVVVAGGTVAGNAYPAPV